MEIFSDLMFVGECLLDEERVIAFRTAIQKTVTSDSIVVDAGSGTGIMALIAVQAGAKKVIAIEQSARLAKIAQENIRSNGFEHVIDLHVSDVNDFILPGFTADVLIMEMLDTGLIAEQQASSIVNLRKNLVISEFTILLPEKVESTAELVNYDFDFFGFKLCFPLQARNFGVNDRVKFLLSDPIVYNSTDFTDLDLSCKVDAVCAIPIIQGGDYNAVRINSSTFLFDEVLGATTDLNMPIIIPLPQASVRESDVVNLKISYSMGEGLVDNLDIEVM